MSKDQAYWFNTGIICALIVLVHDGYEEHAFEILKGCDLKAIKRIAKQEGDLRIVKLVNDFQTRKRDRERYCA